MGMADRGGTSPDRLHRDWRAARARAEIGVVEGLLARLRPGAALVTVGDFHPARLSWLGAFGGNTIVPLGVDRFGQSGDIPHLCRARGIDTEAIPEAAARACLTELRQTERSVPCPAFRSSTAAADATPARADQVSRGSFSAVGSGAASSARVAAFSCCRCSFLSFLAFLARSRSARSKR